MRNQKKAVNQKDSNFKDVLQNSVLSLNQLHQIKGGNGHSQNQSDDEDHIGIIDLVDG